jgi:hypothetical protein
MRRRDDGTTSLPARTIASRIPLMVIKNRPRQSA